MKSIKYTIAIATFRRPEYLADLLQDLSHQEGNIDFSEWEVLVCDNDANESAKSVFEKAKLEKLGRSEYFTVKEQNISLARNKLFEEAKGEALIYVDDDQRVKSDFCYQVAQFWLQYKERITGAKFQVTTVFDSPNPTWLRQTNFFERRLPEMGEPISGFGTGGSIFRRERLAPSAPPFDPQFGKTGGEDFELFLRLKNQGHVFVSAAPIEVLERLPAQRETIGYLIKRDFFRSVTYGKLILMSYFPKPRFVDLSLILVKSVVSFFLVLGALLLGKRLLLFAFLLLMRQIGKLVGFLGFGFEIYSTGEFVSS